MRPTTLLLLFSMLLGGCAHREVDAQKANSRRIAQEIWAKNQSIVQDALSGQPTIDEEYGSACQFFAHLTGIELRNNMSWVGLLPTAETKEDFKKIQDWYSAHGNRLYWDDRSRSVVLEPKLHGDLDVEKRKHRERAAVEWSRNRMEIFRSAYDAGRIEEFRRARAFFLNLTAFEIPANETPAGPIPNEGTPKSLEFLDKWFRENQHRLYWDEATQSVLVRDPEP